MKAVGATVDQAISVGYKAADLLTQRFDRAPIRMEYEKVQTPLLVHQKKNYAGLKYTHNSVDFTFASTGLPLAKRTSCKFLKAAYLDVMLAVISCRKDEKGKVVKTDMPNPKEYALSRLRHHLTTLREGRVPVNDLLLSKAVKSSYAGGVLCSRCKPDEISDDCHECSGRGRVIKAAHVALADRMKRREPGSEPALGERFAYLTIRDEYRDESLPSNTETPEYASRHGLKPDYQYYLNNQLRIPFIHLFEAVGEGDEANRIFNETEAIIIADIVRQRKAMANSSGGIFNQQSGREFQRGPPKHSTMYKRSKKAALDKAHNGSGMKLTDYFQKTTKAPSTTLAASTKRPFESSSSSSSSSLSKAKRRKLQ